MSHQNESSRVAIGFILGAVVVVLAGIVWYLASDGNPFGRNNPGITIQLPESDPIEIPLSD